MNHILNSHPNPDSLLSFLQQYATDSLRRKNQDVIESLRRRRIDTNKIPSLENCYKILLKLGSNIPLESIEKQILEQIDAIADFIADFQIGTLGQPNTLFQIYEFEIVIDFHVQYALNFELGKFSIQFPYWHLNLLNRQLPYQTIKGIWNRGRHLNKFSPILRYWWLFNPLSEFRSNLRAMILLAVDKQILGIDKLFIDLGWSDTGDRKALVPKEETKENTENSNNFGDHLVASAVRQRILSFLKATINEEKLRFNLEQVLGSQDEETLIKLFSSYKENLASPNQIEEILDAGILVLKEVIQEEQSQVDVKMFGFVNVGNYHRIDIALNLSSGYLKKYIEVIPRKSSTKAILFGFVNVYTIDDITVKPNFHGVMKLNFETAALEKSLKELKLLA
jgi:hypothetical protein